MTTEYTRRRPATIKWTWEDINPDNGPVRGVDTKRRNWSVSQSLSAHPDRPWLAYGPRGVLKTKRGATRRFETALSAMAAAERECEKGAVKK